MGYEERNAWVYSIVTVGAAAFYLSQVLGGDPSVALELRDWKGPMLWSIGGAIVVVIVLSIVVNILFGMATGDTNTKADLRDRQISRMGDHVGQGFVIIGANGALILCMLDFNPFWIAHAIYFGFLLSALLSCVARIAAYRFGFSPW